MLRGVGLLESGSIGASVGGLPTPPAVPSTPRVHSSFTPSPAAESSAPCASGAPQPAAARDPKADNAHATSQRADSKSDNPLKYAAVLGLQPLPPSPPGGGGGDGSGGSLAPQPLYELATPLQGEVVLTLASFAVTKLAYVRLTKAFREVYARATGRDVRFRLTFAASGVQARAVIDGLPADIVALALPLDLDKIVAAGLVAPDWRDRYPSRATVCETTVAFVVRRGNPKNISTWEDLVRPGLQVVVANPKTAGVARWIFLALWGSRMKKGDAAALDYVTKVFENVVVQPRDAREASDVFYKQKVGDVLLTYENEVILTNEVYGEKALPYLVPSFNIRIECPLAIVDKVVSARGPEVRQAATEFCRFLFTTPAQHEFAKLGFRVNPATSKEAAAAQTGLPPANLWQVDKELGGWAAAQVKFFDAGAILDGIQASVGIKRTQQRMAAQAAR